jgi:hypothetical protein
LSTTNVQNSKFMWTTGVNLSFDKISCWVDSKKFH